MSIIRPWSKPSLNKISKMTRFRLFLSKVPRIEFFFYRLLKPKIFSKNFFFFFLLHFQTGLYLKGELSAVLEDYKLLDNMNAATASRYQQIDASIVRLNTANSQMNQQMIELLPLMKEIDEIECTVEKLEQAAYRLDAYTTKLENQFKTVFPNKK